MLSGTEKRQNLWGQGVPRPKQFVITAQSLPENCMIFEEQKKLVAIDGLFSVKGHGARVPSCFLIVHLK